MTILVDLLWSENCWRRNEAAFPGTPGCVAVVYPTSAISARQVNESNHRSNLSRRILCNIMNIRPHAPPKLDLPKSNKTVRVRAIDTTTNLVCDSFAFVQPVIPLHKNLNLKTMCFLIEHESLNQKQSVLFDCGARKDYWNGSPQTQRMIGGHVPGLRVDMGVDEVLEKSGFDLKSLSIYSPVTVLSWYYSLNNE